MLSNGPLAFSARRSNGGEQVRALHHVLSDGKQGFAGGALHSQVTTLARAERSEEGSDQLVTPGFPLSYPHGRTLDPAQESLAVSGAAKLGESASGISSEEGRRRRAPHPLSGLPSGRQASGASRGSPTCGPLSHDRDHSGNAGSLPCSLVHSSLPRHPGPTSWTHDSFPVAGKLPNKRVDDPLSAPLAPDPFRGVATSGRFVENGAYGSVSTGSGNGEDAPTPVNGLPCL